MTNIASQVEFEGISLLGSSLDENPKKHEYKLDRTFFHRLNRLIWILLNSPRKLWSFDKQDREQSIFWLYMLFLMTNLCYEYLVTFVSLIPSHFYTILTSKDLPGFLKYLVPSVLIVLATSINKSCLQFLQGLCSIKTRRILTQFVHNRYIKSKHLYSVVSQKEIDNPDQRISQDIEKFSETLNQILTNLIIAPIMAIYYAYRCWTVTGPLGPLVIFLYFVVGTIISRQLIQPIIRPVFLRESQEGYFRFLHVRIQQFAESIAFYGGEEEERKKAQESLDVLLDYQRDVVSLTFPLAMANSIFSYVGSIFSYLVIAIPIFSGVYDDKDATELSAIISANSFVSMYLVFLFTSIIDQSTKCSDLAGYVTRIGELLEVLDEVAENTDSNAMQHFVQSLEIDWIKFEHVDLYSPQSQLVLLDFNLKIEPGHHVAFVGSNGSGKTSILRALAGLWPYQSGKIYAPKDILFLPQIPYLIEGSVKDQLLFPRSSSSASLSDHEAMDLLQKVHLGHLVQKLTSLDTSHNYQAWSELLSPGEQQRLVIARVLFWKPKFVVLDEATSAIDVEAENYLYQLLMSQQGMTVVSISHHPNVIQCHNTIVRLDERKKVYHEAKALGHTSSISGLLIRPLMNPFQIALLIMV
ncbi:ABC transporter transmembrane region 2-domain-containing protein [Blakeslea trispora]|nr:ABC transporter transmembrane region 2-domain-containing protein [Blakeslea trispora]